MELHPGNPPTPLPASGGVSYLAIAAIPRNCGKLSQTVHACDLLRVPPSCTIHVAHRIDTRDQLSGLESVLSVVHPKQTVFRPVIAGCKVMVLGLLSTSSFIQMQDSDDKVVLMVEARRTPSNIPNITLATWKEFAHIFSRTGVVYLT